MENFNPKKIKVAEVGRDKSSGYQTVTYSIANMSSVPIHSVELYLKYGGYSFSDRQTKFHDLQSGEEKRCSFMFADDQFFPPNQWTIIGRLPDQTPFRSLGYLRFGCFVTTAAYGNPHHPMVETFREYRDEVLVMSKLGRGFIDWYYKNGPALAEVVERNSVLQTVARSILTPVAIAIRTLPKPKSPTLDRTHDVG